MKFKEIFFKDKSLKYELFAILAVMILFFIIAFFTNLKDNSFYSAVLSTIPLLISSLIISAITYLILFFIKYTITYFLLKFEDKNLFKIFFIVLSIIFYYFIFERIILGSPLLFVFLYDYTTSIYYSYFVGLIFGVYLGLIYSKKLIEI